MTKKLPHPPNRLRELRKKHGYTLQGLASKVGIDTGYMSKLELGERPLKLEQMRSIAEVYGIYPGEFLNVVDNPTTMTDTERLVVEMMRADQLFACSAMALAKAMAEFRE